MELTRYYQNINSGVLLTASGMDLHRCVARALCASPCMPLDVLEQATIIKEEHLCIPAYLFSYNATGGYNYEAGNTREHKNVYRDGEYLVTEKEQYTEWTQMAGSTSVTGTLVASGCREFADIITPLFGDYSYNSLVAASRLQFPGDVIAYTYDLPHTAALNSYARPVIDQKLRNQAVSGLYGKVYRGLTMTGSNVQISETLQVLLGVYRITCVYEGMEFEVYVSGDGNRFFHRTMIYNNDRKNYLAQKQQEFDNVPLPKFTANVAIAVGGIIFVLATAIMGWKFIFWALVLSIGVPIYFYKKQKRAYDNERNAIQQEIQAFHDESHRVRDNFLDSGHTLKVMISSSK